MSLAMNPQTGGSKSIWLSVCGLLILGIAGVMIYSILQRNPSTQPTDSVYQYKIDQSFDNSVDYSSNSFFNDRSRPDDMAYVADLTDTIKSTLHYRFSGSKATEVTYQYDVKAVVRGTYSLKSDEAKASNVWTKDYQLVKPTITTEYAESFTIDPAIEIPYQNYKAAIEEFRTALALPISTEVVITFTVKASGVVNDLPFEDIRTSTVSAPFNQQIYNLAVKYDKQDIKFVAEEETASSWQPTEHLDIIAAAVIGLLGLALTMYGFRSRIFKTPYQRELDRIYRLHDGIIIRASKPTDLANKSIVSVLSFDDLLNLEEELRVPIIADPVEAETTQFLIIRDDVVYMYTLGKPLIDKTSLDKAEDPFDSETPPQPKRKTPTKKATKPKRIKDVIN